MPKPTFFNLPPAKRAAFLAAAIDEFAAHAYESASISQIVARLGIAKGSLYQYFTDKQDLYLYLLDFARAEKRAFAASALSPDPHVDFYGYTKSLLELGVHFAVAHPRLNQLLHRSTQDPSPLRAQLAQRQQEDASTLIRTLLTQGIAAGELDPDLDLDLTTYLLTQIMGNFSSYMARRLQLDLDRVRAGDYAQLDPAAVRPLLTQAMDLLWRGIARRPA